MVIDRGNFSLFLASLDNQTCWNNNRDLQPMPMGNDAPSIV